MKRQHKIVASIIVVIIVAFGGYYGYQKYSSNKRVQTSYKMMKDEGIKPSNVDKAIVDEMLKNNNDLEYAYIRHNGETVMLNLKFKKGIKDKEKHSHVSKYMEKIRTQYKGKNVNTTIIPSN